MCLHLTTSTCCFHTHSIPYSALDELVSHTIRITDFLKKKCIRNYYHVLEIITMMVVSKYPLLLLCVNSFIYNSAMFRDLTKLLSSLLVYRTLCTPGEHGWVYMLCYVTQPRESHTFTLLLSFIWQTMYTLLNTSSQSFPRPLSDSLNSSQKKENERFPTPFTLKLGSFFSYPPISPQSWKFSSLTFRACSYSRFHQKGNFSTTVSPARTRYLPYHIWEESHFLNSR